MTRNVFLPRYSFILKINGNQQGGIDVDITGVDEAPSTSFWGKLKKSFSDVGDVSIRGDVDANDSDSVALDIRANGFGTAVQMLGRFGEFVNLAFETVAVEQDSKSFL